MASTWKDKWLWDRVISGESRTTLDFSCNDQAENTPSLDVVQVRDEEDLTKLKAVLGKSWIIQEMIEVGGKKIPGGACLYPQGALQEAEGSGDLPDIELPAVLFFEKTPALKQDGAEPLTVLRALDPEGALSQILRANKSNPLHLNFSHQELGDNFVKKLCACLTELHIAPEVLCLVGNQITDVGGNYLAEWIASLSDDMPFRQLDLRLNKLGLLWRTDAVRPLLEKMALWSSKCSRALQEGERVLLDLSFNCIYDPSHHLTMLEETYNGAHGPHKGCTRCSCPDPKGHYPLHVNVGPAWTVRQGQNCAYHEKQWQWYWRPILALLKHELANCDASQMPKPTWAPQRFWQCPLDNGKLNPHHGTKVMHQQRCRHGGSAVSCQDTLSFDGQLESHTLGKKHMKGVRNWDETCGYLDFESADKLWTYRVHPASGQQYWFKKSECDGKPFQDVEECPFLYPDWWRDESWEDSSEGERPSPSAPASSTPRAFPGAAASSSHCFYQGEGSNKREAHALLTAFRLGHMFSGQDRVVLDDKIVVKGIDSEDVAMYIRQGTFEFVWRDYLASRNYDWPEAAEMALEKHATALDYTDEPAIYFVVTFKDSKKYPWRALLHPGSQALFEHEERVFAMGPAWPESCDTQEKILARKAADVYASFKGTHQKRQDRLKKRRNGSKAEPGATDGFNDDIDQYFLLKHKLDESQLRDEKGNNTIHQHFGHRVFFDPLTHRWTADSELASGFWAWLTGESTEEAKELMVLLRRMGEVLGKLWEHFKEDKGWPAGDKLWTTSGELAQELLKAFRDLNEAARAQGLDCGEDFGSVPRVAEKVVEAMAVVYAVREDDRDGWWKAWFPFKELVVTLYDAMKAYAQPKELLVPLSKLRYCQDSISGRFCHGPHKGMRVEDTSKELREKPSLLETCEDLKLQVGLFCGDYRSVNNRRLFCMKKAFQSSPTPPSVRVTVFPLIVSDKEFKTKERENFLAKMQTEMAFSFLDGVDIQIRAHSRYAGVRAKSHSPHQPTVEVRSASSSPQSHKERAPSAQRLPPRPAPTEPGQDPAPPSPQAVRRVEPLQGSTRLWPPVVAISDYDCSQEEFPHLHLSCQEGDKMQILGKPSDRQNENFVTARLIGSPRSGLVPLQLLKIIETESSELGSCRRDYFGSREAEAGYLDLKRGEEVLLLQRAEGLWGYGFSESSCGWFPMEIFSPRAC